jgi:hypothetical protein
MKHRSSNKKKAAKAAVVSVILLVIVQSFLSGCAATGKNPGVTTSREATAIWNSYQILPNYRYYYSGPDAQPFYIIGIDDRYKLMTNLWKPVDLTPAKLKDWINYIQPRYNPWPYGAYITGPNREQIGLWYSVRDWRRKGSAILGENNQVTVTIPPSEKRRKSLLLYPKD